MKKLLGILVIGFYRITSKKLVKEEINQDLYGHEQRQRK